jgi:hypothetical protein
MQCVNSGQAQMFSTETTGKVIKVFLLISAIIYVVDLILSSLNDYSAYTGKPRLMEKIGRENRSNNFVGISSMGRTLIALCFAVKCLRTENSNLGNTGSNAITLQIVTAFAPIAYGVGKIYWYSDLS